MTATGSRARGRPRSFNDTAQGTLIQSLDRAMDVLKIVASGTGMSLTEIAAIGAQAPATVYRILITLQKHRMVDFDEAAQLWHVGLEAFRIGSSFLGRTRLVEQSRPVMQRLMTATGETANLAIVDLGEVVFVSQVETHETIRAFFRPGTRGPIHASGVGKALLAHFSPEQIGQILTAQSFESFTARTLADENALRRDLDLIVQRGWAVDDEERTVGMRCIAAPIFNQFGEAIAGISLSGPSVRVTPDRDEVHGRQVRAAADEITRAIGGVVPEIAKRI